MPITRNINNPCLVLLSGENGVTHAYRFIATQMLLQVDVNKSSLFNNVTPLMACQVSLISKENGASLAHAAYLRNDCNLDVVIAG